jgi:uncharacterized protein
MGVTNTSLMHGPIDTNFFKTQQIDPAKVAKDGYEALMNGEAHVISEIENKIHLATANVMPDSVAAKQVEKQMEPGDKAK